LGDNNNVSSSGKEEEEGEDATAAADKRPSATAADAADTADAIPKTAYAVTNPGFRIVDIEMPGSGFSVQPIQMVQTTAATAAVNAAAT
jgi:hypothetical protein